MRSKNLFCVPQTAVITGASSGIGWELVNQLTKHPALSGIRIVATARRGDRLAELVNSCPTGSVIPFQADLAKADDRARLWEFVNETLGTPDLLVNNAGLGTYGLFQDQGSEQINQIFRVDVEAVMDLTALALRPMIKRNSGQIVQISSILGEVGIPYSSTYVAAKHAVNGLVKSVRYELSGTGVKIWAACPGQTVSEFRQVAGQGNATTRGRTAEPTSKVVAGIVNAIVRGHSRAFLYPTWRPWIIAHLVRLSPALWDLLMVRYGKYISEENKSGESNV